MPNFASELALKRVVFYNIEGKKKERYARLITVKPEKLHVCKSDDGVISFHV